MKVEYSRLFIKSVQKLSGKMLESVKKTIQETIEADKPEQLTNCEKLTGYKNVYRLRIGDLRAFIMLNINDNGHTVVFEYLVPRGQAYDKKIMENLRNKDR